MIQLKFPLFDFAFRKLPYFIVIPKLKLLMTKWTLLVYTN